MNIYQTVPQIRGDHLYKENLFEKASKVRSHYEFNYKQASTGHIYTIYEFLIMQKIGDDDGAEVEFNIDIKENKFFDTARFLVRIDYDNLSKSLLKIYRLRKDGDLFGELSITSKSKFYVSNLTVYHIGCPPEGLLKTSSFNNQWECEPNSPNYFRSYLSKNEVAYEKCPLFCEECSGFEPSNCSLCAPGFTRYVYPYGNCIPNSPLGLKCKKNKNYIFFSLIINIKKLYLRGSLTNFPLHLVISTSLQAIGLLQTLQTTSTKNIYPLMLLKELLTSRFTYLGSSIA